MSEATESFPTRGDQPVIASSSALKDRKELAAFALEHTRMPIAISDPRLPDNPLVLVNGSFLEQTGYTAGEVIGRNCRFLQGQDTDPAAIQCVRDAVRNVRPVTVELLNYRKDGRPFWNQLHVSPVHGPSGELTYFFASQLDVTEQRRAQVLEQSEQTLLLEVDHRAKNALALVQGIVRLSGRQSGTDAYADAVSGRIDAISIAHDLLSEARWSNVDLRRLIGSLVKTLGDRRISFDGTGSMLSADQVQPLAVVIHELLFNVVSHGALGRDQGECAIHWRRDGDSIVISITERGTQLDPGPRKVGFGTRVIEQVVTRQLRGQIANDWRFEGLATTLILPAQAA